MAGATVEEDDEFLPFCLTLFRINLGIAVFFAIFILNLSYLSAGNTTTCSYAPVLPGTGAFAYTGTGLNMGNPTAVESDRELNRMQGEEQAANNQAPENVVNSGQGENAVNTQTPEGFVNGGQGENAVEAQTPEGFVNGEQGENAVDTQTPEGFVNGGQGENAVEAQTPEGFVNDGQSQGPVDEQEARRRANSPTAMRAQSAFQSGVSIFYILACLMILVAAWALYLQDPRNVRQFKKKRNRGRKKRRKKIADF